MYNLPYYKEKDAQVVREFIDRHPFAYLSGCDMDNRPVATQVPVFIEKNGDKEVLRGHIMRNTDHHKALVQNENVLVVFTGPHTYVSGTWYSNPHIASTWNYMSVHVKGKIRFLDAAGLEAILRKTTLHYEGYNKESSTIFDNLPQAFKDRVMPAIVGFEIEILEIENIFKLSQDRDEESFQNIIDRLKEQDHDAQLIAGEMEKRKEELFAKR